MQIKNTKKKKIYSLSALTVFILLLAAGTAIGQADTQRVVPPPQPIQYNAGFDVIIKYNGDLIYGLVKEVGPYYIIYKRTDIPDGPVYSIPKNEVYVISYRNQVKDYMNNNAIGQYQYTDPYHENLNSRRYINYKNNNLFKSGSVHFNLGFIKSFSKVENSKDYSSSGSFPVISFGYETVFNNNLNLGLELGFGSRNFSRDEFSSYDSTQNSISLKENIFALYVYGRYYLLNNTSRIQPYIKAGLGIMTSHIRSETKINFTNDNSETIVVTSGARTVGLGVMARIGASYFVSKQLQVNVDAGFGGLSVINAGVSFNIQ